MGRERVESREECGLWCVVREWDEMRGVVGEACGNSVVGTSGDMKWHGESYLPRGGVVFVALSSYITTQKVGGEEVIVVHS